MRAFSVAFGENVETTHTQSVRASKCSLIVEDCAYIDANSSSSRNTPRQRHRCWRIYTNTLSVSSLSPRQNALSALSLVLCWKLFGIHTLMQCLFSCTSLSPVLSALVTFRRCSVRPPPPPPPPVCNSLKLTAT